MAELKGTQLIKRENDAIKYEILSGGRDECGALLPNLRGERSFIIILRLFSSLSWVGGCSRMPPDNGSPAGAQCRGD